MTSPGQEPERDVGNLFIFQREFSRQSTMWSSSTHCVRLFACMCVCVCFGDRVSSAGRCRREIESMRNRGIRLTASAYRIHARRRDLPGRARERSQRSRW